MSTRHVVAANLWHGDDDGGGGGGGDGSGGGGNNIVSEDNINKTKPSTCPYPAHQAPLILLSNAPRPPTPHTQRHIKDYGQSSAPSNNDTLLSRALRRQLHATGMGSVRKTT